MILIPVSQPLFPHSLSLFCRLSSKQTPRYQFSTRTTLSVSPRRNATSVPARELAAFLSCRHSRQNSSCMVATPTLLTRRGRRASASDVRKAVLARRYIHTYNACICRDGYMHSYTSRVIKIIVVLRELASAVFLLIKFLHNYDYYIIITVCN